MNYDMIMFQKIRSLIHEKTLIYCGSKTYAFELKKLLARCGTQAACHVGGDDTMTAEDKRKVLEDFASGNVDITVSTCALEMGFHVAVF